jgi:hypothetical protein
LTYVTSVGSVIHKPDGFRALDVETSTRLNYSSKKRLQSQTSHTINQIEFLIFLRERSMLSEAIDSVTQWELKSMIFFLFFIFRFKPKFHQPVILQISRNTFINSTLISHRPYAIYIYIQTLLITHLLHTHHFTWAVAHVVWVPPHVRGWICKGHVRSVFVILPIYIFKNFTQKQ